MRLVVDVVDRVNHVDHVLHWHILVGTYHYGAVLAAILLYSQRHVFSISSE